MVRFNPSLVPRSLRARQRASPAPSPCLTCSTHSSYATVRRVHGGSGECVHVTHATVRSVHGWRRECVHGVSRGATPWRAPSQRRGASVSRIPGWPPTWCACRAAQRVACGGQRARAPCAAVRHQARRWRWPPGLRTKPRGVPVNEGCGRVVWMRGMDEASDLEACLATGVLLAIQLDGESEVRVRRGGRVAEEEGEGSPCDRLAAAHRALRARAAPTHATTRRSSRRSSASVLSPPT
jgi:hypothetical protein